jgi:hypothetical protein
MLTEDTERLNLSAISLLFREFRGFFSPSTGNC